MLLFPSMTDKVTREDHVYMAKLAEQAERYEDMVSSMKEVCYAVVNIFEL